MELATRVLEFVAAFTAKPVSRLDLAKTLRKDLGIDGDDAAEFMVEFSQAFGVDMSRFEIGRYFSYEGISFPPLEWFRVLTGRERKQSITLGMLVDAATSKRWDN